ncbi:ribose ABC transporter [Parashewanella spongiae]|uniref:Ribose ABC transporter n=1 Tax=Parashewanella spongiae TaxID=342950 RepID=A0A3A6U347_9GAMM|nr:RbsD/FucU domain-containing protein [Parashewanella spongiae]MCL1077935.1 hypothetical protein [Parashewanella spongiae]RJY18445.1 ribose ABC transporter [Parashewanella spongiae]
MLLNINPILTPDILHSLRSMGHGDTLAIVDANFPANSNHDEVITLAGLSVTTVLEAVLSVLPLDTFVAAPCCTMKVVDKPDAVPEIVNDFKTIVSQSPSKGSPFESLERHAFYQAAKDCFTIIQTGETRLYGNIIVTKGIIF